MTLTFTIAVTLLGVAVFIYIQYALYAQLPRACMNFQPKLYVWIIAEVIMFYVSMCLFVSFGGYFAWQERKELLSKKDEEE